MIYSRLRCSANLRLLRLQKLIHSFIFEAFALVLKLPAAHARVLSLSLSLLIPICSSLVVDLKCLHNFSLTDSEMEMEPALES